MIDLLPVPRDSFLCPCGAGPVTVDGFALPGMMPLAKTRCETCNRRFLFHLHTGFCSGSSLAIEEATGALHNLATASWYAYEMQQMWASRNRSSPAVTVRGAFDSQGRDVVLVNTMDPTYGHNIARLFAVSSVKRLFPDSAIVVIVGRFAAWLVPNSADQIWVVDAPLREMHLYNAQVDALTQELARKSARLRYAPIFYGNNVNIEDFTKQPPYAVKSLEDILPARLVYNWREDRCWTYLGRQMPPQEAVADQLRMASLLFEAVRKEIPDLQVTVTGYGKYGKFADWIEDLRILRQTDEAEQAWVRRYARAHVALGIHGSNMHLPSAHAAGSIEIVPPALWYTAHDTWEWVNRHNANNALQRYLKLPTSTSLSDFASIVFSHLRRLQASALFGLLGRIQDVHERERLMVHAFPVLQGGRVLSVTDSDGRPL
jgi:hypothetical protein